MAQKRKNSASSNQGSEADVGMGNSGSDPSLLPRKSRKKLDLDGDTTKKLKDHYKEAFELGEAKIANLERDIADKEEKIRQIRAAERACVSVVLSGMSELSDADPEIALEPPREFGDMASFLHTLVKDMD